MKTLTLIHVLREVRSFPLGHTARREEGMKVRPI